MGQPEPIGRAEEKTYILHVWDLEKRKEQIQHTLKWDVRPLNYGPRFSPNGKILAMPIEDGKVISLVDPVTGKELCRTDEKVATPAFMTFTHDCNLLAASGRDGMIRVYDTATGKLRHEYRGHTAYVRALAICPDGKLLASAAPRQDDAIHIWDLAKRKELHEFGGHRSGQLAVAFLPDGKTLATVSRDSGQSRPVNDWANWSLRLWDAASGKEVRALKTPQEGEIDMTVFSSGGSRLATLRLREEGTLRIWDVREGKLLKEWQVAMRHVVEDFTTPDGKKGRKTYTVHPFHAMTLSPDGETLVTVKHIQRLR
jgi:WD40 repeat protein